LAIHLRCLHSMRFHSPEDTKTGDVGIRRVYHSPDDVTEVYPFPYIPRGERRPYSFIPTKTALLRAITSLSHQNSPFQDYPSSFPTLIRPFLRPRSHLHVTSGDIPLMFFHAMPTVIATPLSFSVYISLFSIKGLFTLRNASVVYRIFSRDPG